MTSPAPLAYFSGEDAWSIDRAARDYRAALEQAAGSQFDVWRAPSDDDDAGDGGASDGATKKKTRVLDEI
ncbi:MAG: hypothetical protein ABI725_07710, partial [Chloroflexota bacterium]